MDSLELHHLKRIHFPVKTNIPKPEIRLIDILEKKNISLEICSREVFGVYFPTTEVEPNYLTGSQNSN